MLDKIKIFRILSSKNSNKRAKAVDRLSDSLSNGCWLTQLSLEYALKHDPNYRVKNKIISLFEKLKIKRKTSFWEKHFIF